MRGKGERCYRSLLPVFDRDFVWIQHQHRNGSVAHGLPIAVSVEQGKERGLLFLDDSFFNEHVPEHLGPDLIPGGRKVKLVIEEKFLLWRPFFSK